MNIQQLPQTLDWILARTKWASILNPFLKVPFLNGSLLTNQALINGNTTFNHLLGRTPQGWVITDLNSAAQIYRSAAFNSSTLTLNSSAAVVVNLWIF